MDYLVLLVKKTGLKLVPFIKAVVVYFLLGTFELENHGKLWSTALKIFPIISLMGFIFLYGINMTKDHRSRQFLLTGLIFSSIGDILLNIDLFPHGMGAFAVAQVFYISSFGFKPLKPMIGIGLYTVGAICVSIFYNNLPPILQIGLPIYGFLLLTMCWRAIARVNSPSNFKHFPKLACAIGAILFVISDSLIACDKFYIPLSFAPLSIMATYYAAQFGITLGIVELDNKRKGQTMNNNNSKAKNGRKLKAQ